MATKQNTFESSLFFRKSSLIFFESKLFKLYDVLPKQNCSAKPSSSPARILRALKIVIFSGKLCNRPLGMQNGRIRNVAITSSSRWDNFHAPHLARLQNKRRGRYMGGWSAKINNAYQWLQIDLKRPTKVVRISTQGRPTVNQWVTSYYLLYSQDGVYFAYYFQRNTMKVWFVSWFSVNRLKGSACNDLTGGNTDVEEFKCFYITYIEERLRGEVSSTSMILLL